ncbi:NAD(P)-dependent alcohol dehydrogenase [Phaeocystidibacter marisrubri]|uniref:NAD(P)-dependent alcohol dehydrogenase n=1 Tax=Phaeocystidibacter marisrubri TaxID=1577780 RepID=A0A6L3ZCH4_9FLAO|nr:NAD(P)-dependent alcohol dehydrogenase [Phaeocystidibacter marisrubri]KAB2815545.1 NAD(P)-dependent alcohol dehydrogenase [Phaeocystidibacter marisrubri]GGH64454.1 NADPH:quinone reductase [Phaeocystidibacter marisrubri]
MRAFVNDTYSAVPKLQMSVNYPEPKLGEGHVRIAVRSTSLNAADLIMMSGKPLAVRTMSGLFGPKHKVLGADVAGVVVAMGPNVHHLKIGDAVFGDLSADGFGGLAEYVSAPAYRFIPVPRGLSFEEAASLPMAGVTALKALRDKANVKRGDRVLIIGASGGVGSLAVQLATAMGAEVWAVCSSKKRDSVQNLGAMKVIDYKAEDYTKSKVKYDAVIDMAAKVSWKQIKNILAPSGVYVPVAVSLSATFASLLGGSAKRNQIRPLLSSPSAADLYEISKYVESLQLRPVIHQTYPLERVNEAIRSLQKGEAFGKIVIAM